MIFDEIDRPVTHEQPRVELVPYERQVRLAVSGSRARCHNPPVDSIGR